jgi:hypothetical protein
LQIRLEIRQAGRVHPPTDLSWSQLVGWLPIKPIELLDHGIETGERPGLCDEFRKLAGVRQ